MARFTFVLYLPKAKNRRRFGFFFNCTLAHVVTAAAKKLKVSHRIPLFPSTAVTARLSAQGNFALLAVWQTVKYSEWTDGSNSKLELQYLGP